MEGEASSVVGPTIGATLLLVRGMYIGTSLLALSVGNIGQANATSSRA
jgi:hypothetical protein